MTTNTTTPEQIKTVEKQIEIERNIISTITEYSSQFETALINTLFQSLIFNNEECPDKEQLDSLRLLWQILQEAKKL